MEDKDIIYALECCNTHRCVDCPYGSDCLDHLTGNALELINKQQKEIERLGKYNTEVAHKHYDDGIKEFADKLKGHKFPYTMHGGITVFYYTEEDIDNLVKEMVGQNDEK